MRQDYFEFIPQFKLWFSSNHKPALRSVDEATRRRFNLLPFTVTIAKDKRDPKFAEDKLTTELPGILAWMIEGCLEWQKNGLRPPQAVKTATDEYLQDEDALKRWFTEECVVDPQSEGLFTTELYAAWKTWAATAGEFNISERRFSQALEAKSAELGIQKQNNLHRGDKHGRGFMGVRWPRAPSK
jgi:putative DNA primase/helicase